MSSSKTRTRYKQGHVEVHINNQKDFERALSRFKRLVREEGVLELYKEKSVYMKPSDKKRKKKSDADYRRRKNK
jgi:ribosomal protein S21